MNIFIVIQTETQGFSVENMEAFANPMTAAAAIRRLGWAEEIAVDLETREYREGHGIRLVSPDKTSILDVGCLKLEGVMTS